MRGRLQVPYGETHYIHSQRMESRAVILWDFVEFVRVTLESIKTGPQIGNQGRACKWAVVSALKLKMSGRWGDRPPGRGDGGNSNPKWVWFFCRPVALASSRTTHRSKSGLTPENPNNSRLLGQFVLCRIPRR